ncbi:MULTISPECIES: FGGY-family carbohydrate kinase [Prochlorococcus]|uniref:FGGY-family carbohydrate kinase n=1 Tax=Prochlorococcus TaxID=1218 RepID=UPI0005338684|nr:MULTISPECIES: FGGY-family carbohydrate kinase [Prochlorococcus]KGG13046.1 putative carbohydrate kinase [Prochlorococcus sp. MIT 0601]
MKDDQLAMGIDLGTSGVRIAIINAQKKLIYSSSENYLTELKDCNEWVKCISLLIKNTPKKLKNKISACAVDGTSGTLLACDSQGKPLGPAIPYYISLDDIKESVPKKAGNNKSKLNSTPSISKAIYLVNKYGSKILLRHQADWIIGWLANNWEYGEEGNNLKLGWNLLSQKWNEEIGKLNLENHLPKIIPSGHSIGTVSESIAKALDLPQNMQIILGTTDSNAAILASNPDFDDGVTVLGSTIVIKRFVNKPMQEPGVTNHFLGGQWIAGGASNAGCSVLKQFFSDKDLMELSRQIDPEIDSGLNLLPLACKGERFPVEDPNLDPILEPRPISDSLYLHGLLEGMANIEKKGWSKFRDLIGSKPKRIITIGGGARNPQWRRIRERKIGIPIVSSNRQPAEGVAYLAMQAVRKQR